MLIHGGRSSKNYMNPQTNTTSTWEKPLGLQLAGQVEFWAPHFSRKARILYLLKYVHTMGHDYSEILYILNHLGRATFPFFFCLTHLNPGETQRTLRWCLGMLWPKGMK